MRAGDWPFRPSFGYNARMGKPKKSSGRSDEVPPIWEWLAQQHNNADPLRAEAVRHVGERWQFGPWYNHRKVMSTLQAEESEHLHGMRLLQQDFVEFFDIEPEGQIREHGLGVVSPLIPVGREQCTHTYRSGRRCRRDAVPGAGMCGDHGGSWISETERAEMVEKISQRLVDIGDRAIATMADLMDNAKSEKVRGDMAIAILDRIGVGPINKVELSVTPEAERVAHEVRARILELKKSNETIIGEVVEGETEGSEAAGA